jgi:hypothetical protein
MATWQLAENPVNLVRASGVNAIPARRIQDHRRFYLDYEGPVSGNRGHVTRVDRGTYTLLNQQPRHWSVRLAGSVLIGTFDLEAKDDLKEADAGEKWTVYRTFAP